MIQLNKLVGKSTFLMGYIYTWNPLMTLILIGKDLVLEGCFAPK